MTKSLRMLVVLGAAAACTTVARDNSESMTSGSSFLVPVQGCDELEALVQQHMAERVGAQIQTNLEMALQMGENAGCRWEEDGAAGGGGPYPSAATTNATGGASQYSTTNNQVAGVDEADFVKNDGTYVYLVTGDRFVVLQAWPAASTHPIGEIALEGRPLKLFTVGDRAVVYSETGQGRCMYQPGTGGVAVGTSLKITVLDISNRAAPRLEREIRVSGSFNAARRIGTSIHTVVAFQGMQELSLPTWPQDLGYCGTSLTEEQIRAAFAQLLADDLDAIAQLTIADMLPSGSDVDFHADGTSEEHAGLFVDCANFYAPTGDQTPGFLTVLSFPADDDTRLGDATIVGQGGTVYASAQNLYVAQRDHDPNMADPSFRGADERTIVHKFGLAANGSAPFYRTSGAVPGRILNQFSMDEHDNFLRIATTEGYLPDPNTTNNVFVLEERAPVVMTNGHLLAIAGELRGIAPDEDIRSARFDGPRGFVVTFKKTDPLFVLDLSDPRAPRIAGELKIPGFSTYMHFMDRDHLLTIGFDASDQGSFAWFTGIQLQIFDVTDMANPRLAHKEVIGTRGTTSDATSDHLAFNYFPALNLLAIPMAICEGGNGNGGYGTTMTFNGLLVYRVTAGGGFAKVGGVDHRDGAQGSCSNWWQNPDSQVKRSIFMDDFVYSLSGKKLKVNALATLSSDLVSVALPGGTDRQPYRCGY